MTSNIILFILDFPGTDQQVCHKPEPTRQQTRCRGWQGSWGGSPGHFSFQCQRSPWQPILITSLLCMHFFAQVNTSITELNLTGNLLGPEGGKAIAKSLEVCHALSLSWRQIDFFFFFCLNYAGQQDSHQREPEMEQPWSGGRKSDRQIAWGEIFIFIVITLSMTSNVCVCVFLSCLLFSHAGKQDAD
jgi:hypothetical protein